MRTIKKGGNMKSFFEITLSSLLLLVLLFNLTVFAQEAATVKSEDKYSYLETLGHLEKLTEPLKRHLKENKIELEFFAGILQGFDNNVNLDPERKKDGFLETSLNTELTYNYTDDIRLKLENYTTNILYYNVNNSNMIDINNEIGFEVDLADDMFTIGANYALDPVVFANDMDGTYIGNQASLFLEHHITDYLYQKVGYKFLYKGFTNNKIREFDRTPTTILRRDSRNSVDYELGLYIMNKAIVKAYLEVFRNDSNYKFMHFFNYWSFKVRPSFIYMFTDKLYASGSFTFQKRNYDDRLSSKNGEHVSDNTCSFSVSGLYDLTKSFTVAVNYSYRENTSNEPLQKYSGSTMTAGVYYSF